MKRIFLLAVMGCYLAFAYLLYHRWLVTEAAYGGPIEFAQLLGGTHDPGIYCERDATTGVQTPLLSAVWSSSSYPDSAPKQFSPCLLAQRMSWFSVLIPLWVADGLTLSAHAALVLMQHATRPPEQAYNARLEHANGFCHAVLYALFKVLLLGRLSSPSSPALSWYLIFAPIYAAAVLQAILHSFKTLEGGEALFRGRDPSRPRRRPGFFLTLDDTLAFNISLHLSGSFYVRNATWSVVFWPLWLVAAVCGVGLFLLICFGVPMLSRRYPTRQFLMVLPPLMLLLATYSHSMLASTRRRSPRARSALIIAATGALTRRVRARKGSRWISRMVKGHLPNPPHAPLPTPPLPPMGGGQPPRHAPTRATCSTAWAAGSACVTTCQLMQCSCLAAMAASASTVRPTCGSGARCAPYAERPSNCSPW